jgi:hypothetical protein
MEGRLSQLVDSIQQLNGTEYEELFKLLYQNKCEYTQNNNGIFLNLSWLKPELLEKIELFVQFCKASRRELQHYETLCKDLSSGMPSQILMRAPSAATVAATASSSAAASGTTGANVSGNGVGTTAASAVINPAPAPVASAAATAAWMNFTRNTSTMKFYLMKKRYAKMASFETNLQSDLEKEDYVL